MSKLELTEVIDKSLSILPLGLMHELWQEVQTGHGSAFSEGIDKDNRAKYVGLQGFIELSLAILLQQGKIAKSVEVIHTKLP